MNMVSAFKALLEIFLISVALYYLYRLFKGTRGASVLTGLVMLLASLILITELLDLRVLSYLLKASSAFLVISVVILFQPELRRVLSQLGSGLTVTHSSQQSQVIEITVQALEDLKEKKYGALIAFERNVTHAHIRQTGVAIYGHISQELLETIFTNKTPLHDGGVMIYGNQIVAAGCIFPVSQRQDLSRTLGMRHRAALGFTEETDVVVAVLSEETGDFSLCYAGELMRPLSADALRRKLGEVLLPSKKNDPASWFERFKLWMKDRGNVS